MDFRDLPTVLPESFAVVREAMGGHSVHALPEAELLHIIEAASHLEGMVTWVRSAVVPAAKASGASWAKLAAAMGVTRSTVQYRYEKAAKDWAAGSQA